MSLAIFLQLDGVDGESTDDRHRNQIDLLSYSWGETQLIIHSGGGGGASKVQVQELHCALHTCKATPALFLGVANGRHFRRAVLTVQRGGQTPVAFLQWALGDVTLSAFETAAEHGSASAPIDQLSLHFNTLEIAYRQQRADGSLETAIQVGWDVIHNRAI